MCELLEEALGVRGIVITAGHGSREKVALVPGLRAWPEGIELS